MTDTITHTPLTDAEKKQGTFTKLLDGTTLTAAISPCVWMYPNYGLQIEVALPAGGKVFLNDKAVSYEAITRADIDRLLDGVSLCACKTCGRPAFDPATHPSNREGECESCFMSALRVQFDKDNAKAEKQAEALMAKQDARYKASGHTHRVVAVVHPKAGGDDRMVDIYFREEPTHAAVRAELKRLGSAVLDDFTVVTL